MKSEDIATRRWTDSERRAIRQAARSQATNAGSATGDMPRLTETQLASMVRLRAVPRKVAVSVRLDPQVLEWLRAKGSGHITRINDILTNIMEAEQRVQRR